MKYIKKLLGSMLLIGVVLCSANNNQIHATNVDGDTSTKFNTGSVSGTEQNQETSPSGYRPPGFKVPSITEDSDNSSDYPRVSASNLDTKYSSKEYNRVTSIKDQGKTGTCWAFAAIAASESNLISQGAANTSIDLSEHHLAYFNNNLSLDPLGGTVGDKVTLPSGVSYLDVGGNLYSSTISLANWVGATNDSVAPFPANGQPTTLDNSLAYNYDTVHLQNASWISMTDSAIVKQMIIDKGAGVVSFRIPDTESEYYNYFNDATSSFYYNGTAGSNHEVAIIGWDDTYSRDNFGGNWYLGYKPVNNGAWLIKNSWGETGDQLGYYWISYEDTSLRKSDAAFFNYEPATNYIHNYQYDGTSNINSQSNYSNQVYMANVFTSVGCEAVEAVSFYTGSPNTSYSIQIYTSLTDQVSPVSGTKAFSVEQVGSATYAGYHTVNLTQPVSLSSGERFSVVIKLVKPGAAIPIFLDKTQTYLYDSLKYLYLTFTSYSSAGQCFFSTTGTYWDDIYDNDTKNMTFRIKAFTNARADIAGATISAIPNQPFNGIAVTPKVSVVKDGRLLTESAEYTLSYLNNAAAGTATVIVHGAGTYAGSIAKTFVIDSLNLSTATLKISKIKNQTYTGSAKKPSVKVYSGAYALTKNFDYKVSYKNNKKIGTAKIILTGINKFTGTKTITFKIVPKKVTISKIKSSKSKTATLSWKKISGATGYQILYSTKKSSGYKQAGTTSKLVYTKKSLKKNKNYYFKVRAYKTVNKKRVYGAYSSAKYVKIK